MAVDAGHGALVKLELDPSGSPGTFTTMGKVQDVDWPELTVPVVPSHGQEDSISTHEPAEIVMVGSMSVTAWYDPTDTTHNISQGVYDQLTQFEKRGLTITGPGGGTDVFVCSGYATNVGRSAPVGDGGMYEITFSFQPSGAISIDATAVS